MEDVTDADLMHTKRVFEDFEIKHLDEYHHLFVQSDTLLPADVFENFRNLYLKIYEPDHAPFHTSPGLTRQET